MKQRKSLNRRALMSVGLFFSLLMLPVTAVLIHATHGRPASHTWLHIHVVFGVLFMIFGAFHAVYNRKALVRYMRGTK
ncbi:DUF4405 domain-containing protein [Alistipes sp. OttesenSCG-928-L06]|nr:DUF4405 domain-containing protein [Alistipes sp. OttesenSCG-928-L06]